MGRYFAITPILCSSSNFYPSTLTFIDVMWIRYLSDDCPLVIFISVICSAFISWHSTEERAFLLYVCMCVYMSISKNLWIPVLFSALLSIPKSFWNGWSFLWAFSTFCHKYPCFNLILPCSSLCTSHFSNNLLFFLVEMVSVIQDRVMQWCLLWWRCYYF